MSPQAESANIEQRRIAVPGRLSGILSEGGTLERMDDIARMELECVIRETGPDPRHAVVWLHGLGADGHDFEPIVPQLQSAARRPVRFVFPHAPVRPVTINAGMAMRAWYDITGQDIAREQDRDGIRDALARVGALLEREEARGTEAANIILAGFSQGGAIALRCGLARTRPLAGILALSCYLLDGDTLDAWAAEESAAVPVFMGHGQFDPVVPYSLGKRSARRLEQAGYPVTWRSWPMPHAVCAEEIEAVDAWLEERLR